VVASTAQFSRCGTELAKEQNPIPIKKKKKKEREICCY
jgi:hypothetical protein